MIYLDTSAAIKALILEPDSHAIRSLFESEAELISSRLLAVELHAVADRRGLDARNVRTLIERVAVVSLDDGIARQAIDIRSGLRTLDALHLATALMLGDFVSTFLSFDDELNSAVQKRGLALHSLGRPQDDQPG